MKEPKLLCSHNTYFMYLLESGGHKVVVSFDYSNTEKIYITNLTKTDSEFIKEANEFALEKLKKFENNGN